MALGQERLKRENLPLEANSAVLPPAGCTGEKTDATP